MEHKNEIPALMESLKYMCLNIYGLLRVPIILLDAEGENIFQLPDNYIFNPIYPDFKLLYKQLLNNIDDTTIVFTNSTRFLENYTFVFIRKHRKMTGTIVIGPCLFSEIDLNSIDELIKKLNIQIKFRKDLIYYYKHLTIASYNALINACSILYYFLYHKQLSIVTLLKNADIYDSFPRKIMNASTKNTGTFEAYMLQNRRNGFSHHSPKYESELLDYIKKGNIDSLMNFLEKKPAEKYGHLSGNPLRNHKDLFISFIPLVSHAAIEGGLDWELSLSLGDYYIRIIENETSIRNIFNIYPKMFIDFTKRVNSTNSIHSVPIIKCKNYILENLLNKITLTDISKSLGLNANYLSHLFKKEMGLTISDYIQRERIEIAKRMISLSDKSLSEIYTSLGYIDQSHFTKTFKKFTGLTPGRYKLSHRNI